MSQMPELKVEELILDFESEIPAEPPASILSAPPERYITGATLRAMPPSEMDATVDALVRGCERGREWLMRMLELEERLVAAEDRLTQMLVAAPTGTPQ